MTSSSLHRRALAVLFAGLLSCGGAAPEPAGPPFVEPMRLSESGLYSDFASRTLAPGVRPFTPRYELWSDGAEKERFLLLPEGKRIDTSDMERWAFPIGTRAWKQFKRNGRLVETRLLWKVKEGKDGWFQMAYAWNAEGTEALPAPAGQVNANETPHDVPAQKTCKSCHEGVRDFLIGPSAVQLGGVDGPLTEWAKAGLLSHAPERAFEVPGNPTEQAALGYLHGNCSHCHNDTSALAEKRTMRLNVRTTDATVEQTGPYRTTFNTVAFHVHEGSQILVVPGAPEASQLLSRAALRDAKNVNDAFGFQMPPTCTEEPDVAGLAAVRAWIEQL